MNATMCCQSYCLCHTPFIFCKLSNPREIVHLQAEVRGFQHDGSLHLQARSQKYGKVCFQNSNQNIKFCFRVIVQVIRLEKDTSIFSHPHPTCITIRGLCESRTGIQYSISTRWGYTFLAFTREFR